MRPRAFTLQTDQVVNLAAVGLIFSSTPHPLRIEYLSISPLLAPCTKRVIMILRRDRDRREFRLLFDTRPLTATRIVEAVEANDVFPDLFAQGSLVMSETEMHQDQADSRPRRSVSQDVVRDSAEVKDRTYLAIHVDAAQNMIQTASETLVGTYLQLVFETRAKSITIKKLFIILGAIRRPPRRALITDQFQAARSVDPNVLNRALERYKTQYFRCANANASSRAQRCRRLFVAVCHTDVKGVRRSEKRSLSMSMSNTEPKFLHGEPFKRARV